MRKVLRNLLLGAGIMLSAAITTGCGEDEEVQPQESLINFKGMWDLTYEKIEERGRTTVYDLDVNTDIFLELFQNGDFNILHSYSMEDYHHLVFTNRPEDRGFWTLSGRYLTLHFDDNYDSEWKIERLTKDHCDMWYEPAEGERISKTRHFVRLYEEDYIVDRIID